MLFMFFVLFPFLRETDVKKRRAGVLSIFPKCKSMTRILQTLTVVSEIWQVFKYKTFATKNLHKMAGLLVLVILGKALS